MKLIPLALLLVTTATADTIYFTDGRSLTGQVTGYSRMTFEFLDDKGQVSRHPQATVNRIEFTGGEATITTGNRGPIRGVLTGYNNSQFILKTATGEERVATTIIREVNFGDAAAKAIDQVTGSDLLKHVPRGKVTIVDFYADWCGPCRMIAPHLERMARDDADVVLRKVNVDRNGALSKQYGVRGIPHIIVFDKAGNEVGKITGADPDGVKRLVAKAKGS